MGKKRWESKEWVGIRYPKMVPKIRDPRLSNHHLLNNFLGNNYCCRRNTVSAHSEAITSSVPRGSCHGPARRVCMGSASPFSWRLQTWSESHYLDEQHISLLSGKLSRFLPDPSLQGHLPRRKKSLFFHICKYKWDKLVNW